MSEEKMSTVPEIKIEAELKSEDVIKALQMTERQIDRGTGFLSKVIGQPLVIVGAMVSDVLSAFQWRCRVAIGERAQRICEERQIDPQSLPPEFVMPVMVAGATAAEPEIQELWAQLLTLAIENEDARHPAYIDVIRRLSAAEAFLFSRLLRNGPSPTPDGMPSGILQRLNRRPFGGMHRPWRC